MRQILTAGLSAIALMTAIPATAAVIVDTGAPVGGSGGWVLAANQFLAAKFTSPTTVLTNLEGYIFGAAAGETFHVVLYADGGALPGAELFSMSASYSGVEDWQGVNGVSWAVAAGDYFVAFEVRSVDTLSGSMANPAPSPLGVEAFTRNGAYEQFDGLDIGVRISDGGAVVPEPATWGLMITGFGLVGTALRRRRVVAA